MLSFELAQELKAAGFPQSTSPHAVYSLNDHLRIRREHAVQMWYGNKTKIGVPLRVGRGGRIYAEFDRARGRLRKAARSCLR
jgi:hypothetical protein